ncbi:hypothetical protein GTV15_22875, partial [Streptomyces sp. SID7803]|nr:hypothetical protein [Streptomyces sp. SID7803]
MAPLRPPVFERGHGGVREHPPAHAAFSQSEAREEMSAPNKSYDPVEVEALKPEEIER